MKKTQIIAVSSRVKRKFETPAKVFAEAAPEQARRMEKSA